MLQRSGSAFSMDNSRNPVGGYGFPTNKYPSMGMVGYAGMGQFPPQILQGSIQNRLPSGLQSPLGMLSDMATMGNNNKRGTSDYMQGDPNKRQRLAAAGAPVNTDGPVLIKRLSSMTGGFPMPKWAGVNKTANHGEPRNDNAMAMFSDITEKKVQRKHGAFPMPPLTDGTMKSMSKLSLRSYRQLWKDTDSDLREEVLARKMERTSLKLFNRKSS